MHDLGDTVTLTAKSVDAAGVATNATAVTTTVTLPDGTIATPSGSYGPVGTYTANYVPSQVGRHAWRMTFTGVVPDQAYSDVFHVWPPTSTWIVGLAETKDHLNIAQATTTHDEELRRTIAGATGVVEDIVGIVARRNFVQTFSGRGDATLLLSYRPVISVTSVVEDSVTLAASDYTVSEHGVLTRVAALAASWWRRGVRNITVTYVAGRAIVPDNIVDGTRDLIRANFRPQLGGNRSPYDRGERAAEGGEMRLGFFVPHSVMERLGASSRGPHVG